jgi:hypothetical protein
LFVFIPLTFVSQVFGGAARFLNVDNADITDSSFDGNTGSFAPNIYATGTSLNSCSNNEVCTGDGLVYQSPSVQELCIGGFKNVSCAT